MSGVPYSDLRPGGWAWLAEGERLDQYAVCAVADVAHTVVVASLADCDTTTARRAVQVAVTAAPDEEQVVLDLAAVTQAEGHADDAEQVVRDQVCNHAEPGEAPSDLSDRGRTVLAARGCSAAGRPAEPP